MSLPQDEAKNIPNIEDAYIPEEMYDAISYQLDHQPFNGRPKCAGQIDYLPWFGFTIQSRATPNYCWGITRGFSVEPHAILNQIKLLDPLQRFDVHLHPETGYCKIYMNQARCVVGVEKVEENAPLKALSIEYFDHQSDWEFEQSELEGFSYIKLAGTELYASMWQLRDGTVEVVLKLRIKVNESTKAHYAQLWRVYDQHQKPTMENFKSRSYQIRWDKPEEDLSVKQELPPSQQVSVEQTNKPTQEETKQEENAKEEEKAQLEESFIREYQETMKSYKLNKDQPEMQPVQHFQFVVDPDDEEIIIQTDTTQSLKAMVQAAESNRKWEYVPTEDGTAVFVKFGEEYLTHDFGGASASVKLMPFSGDEKQRWIPNSSIE